MCLAITRSSYATTSRERLLTGALALAVISVMFGFAAPALAQAGSPCADTTSVMSRLRSGGLRDVSYDRVLGYPTLLRTVGFPHLYEVMDLKVGED